MANVSITSEVKQAQYAGTFESVNTDARIIVQDGVVTISDGGSLYLENGWTLVCDSFKIDGTADNILGSTVPSDPDDESAYHLILKDSEIRVNGGSASNSNQLQDGRVFIRNGVLRNTSTNSSGQYAFGSFQDNNAFHRTYYNIKGLIVSGQTQRTLIQFFRATSGSIVEDIIFEYGHTDLNFNSGAEVKGINVNPLNADSDVGIETKDCIYDKIRSGPDASGNYTFSDATVSQIANNPHRDADTGIDLISYFDSWVFDDKSDGNNLADFKIIPRPGNTIVLVDPIKKNGRGIRFEPIGSQSLQGATLLNGKVLAMDTRFRFRPVIEDAGVPVENAYVKISHSDSKFQTYYESGRTLYSDEESLTHSVGGVDVTVWSLSMGGKYKTDYTVNGSNVFSSDSNGTFEALVRTGYRDATRTIYPYAGSIVPFTGDFGFELRHYNYLGISGNRDYEDVENSRPKIGVVVDSFISEMDYSSALAKTELGSWDDVYDYLKAVYCTFGTIDGSEITPKIVNGKLDVGDINVNLTTSDLTDGSGNTVTMTYNSSTKDLKVRVGSVFSSGNKIKECVTTGGIFVVSGSTVELTAQYVDKFGKAVVIEPSVDSTRSLVEVIRSTSEIPDKFVMHRHDETGSIILTDKDSYGETDVVSTSNASIKRVTCVVDNELWMTDASSGQRWVVVTDLEGNQVHHSATNSDFSSGPLMTIDLEYDGQYVYWLKGDGNIYRTNPSDNSAVDGGSAFVDLDVTCSKFTKIGGFWYVWQTNKIVRYDDDFTNPVDWHTGVTNFIDFCGDINNIYVLMGATSSDKVVSSFARNTKNGTLTQVFDTGEVNMGSIAVARGNNKWEVVVHGTRPTSIFVFPPTSTVKITSKAFGYLFDRRDVDVANSTKVEIPMVRNVNVDIGVDLTDIGGYSDSDTEDRVYSEFKNNERMNLVFGEINLKGQFIKSIAVFDNRMSEDAAIRFRHYWDQGGSVSALSGDVYEVKTDRLVKQDGVIEFTRMSGLDITKKSQYGAFVTKADGITAYQPPVSNGDDVRIGDLSTLNILDSDTVVNAVERVRENTEYINDFATATSVVVRDDMKESDYFTALVGLSTKSKSSGSTDDEIAKLYERDTVSKLVPTSSSAATTWEYVVVECDKVVKGSLLPELTFEIGGSIVSGTPDTDIGTRIEVKMFGFEEESDLPSSYSTYIGDATNVPVISTTGSPGLHSIDVSTHDIGYLLVAYRSTQVSDDYLLSMKNLKIRHSPARAIHSASVDLSGEIGDVTVDLTDTNAKLDAIDSVVDAIKVVADGVKGDIDEIMDGDTRATLSVEFNDAATNDDEILKMFEGSGDSGDIQTDGNGGTPDWDVMVLEIDDDLTGNSDVNLTLDLSISNVANTHGNVAMRVIPETDASRIPSTHQQSIGYMGNNVGSAVYDEDEQGDVTGLKINLGDKVKYVVIGFDNDHSSSSVNRVVTVSNLKVEYDVLGRLLEFTNSKIDGIGDHVTQLWQRLTRNRAGLLDNLLKLDTTISSRMVGKIDRMFEIAFHNIGTTSNQDVTTHITSATGVSFSAPSNSTWECVIFDMGRTISDDEFPMASLTVYRDNGRFRVFAFAADKTLPATDTDQSGINALFNTYTAPELVIDTGSIAGDITLDLKGKRFRYLAIGLRGGGTSAKISNLDLSISENIVNVLGEKLTDERAALLDNLENLDATVSSRASASALTTVDNEIGVIDGIVDAIKTETDKIQTVDNEIAVIDGNVDTLVSRLTSARAALLDELSHLDADISSISGGGSGGASAEEISKKIFYDVDHKILYDGNAVLSTHSSNDLGSNDLANISNKLYKNDTTISIYVGAGGNDNPILVTDLGRTYYADINKTRFKITIGGFVDGSSLVSDYSFKVYAFSEDDLPSDIEDYDSDGSIGGEIASVGGSSSDAQYIDVEIGKDVRYILLSMKYTGSSTNIIKAIAMKSMSVEYKYPVYVPKTNEISDRIERDNGMLENLDDKVDVVDGIVDGIKTNVDTVDTVVDAIKSTVDTNVDATISSRLPTASYTAPTAVDLSTTNSKIDAVKTVVDSNSGKLDTIDGEVGVIDGVVDGIKTTTDKIGFSGDGSMDDPYLVASTASIEGDVNVDLTATNNKIDAVKTVVDSNATKLDTIDGEVGVIDGEVGTIDGVVDAIKVVTDKIRFDGDGSTSDPYKVEANATATVDLSTTNTKIDGVKTVVDGIKTETDKIQGIDDNVDSVITKVDTIDGEIGTIDSEIGVVDGIVDAIKTVTDKFNFSGSGTTSDPYKVQTDTGTVSVDLSSTNTKIDAVKTVVDSLPSAIDVSDRIERDDGMLENTDDKVDVIDGIVDAIKAVTDKIRFSGSGTTGDPYLVESNAEVTADLSTTNNKIDAIRSVVDGTSTKVDTVDTVVDAIKVTTDKIGFSGDGSSDSPYLVEADTAEVDFTDTHGKIDAIKTVVDSNATKLDTVDNEVGTIDGVVDAIKTVTDKFGFDGDGSSSDPYLVQSNADADLATTDGKIDAVKTVVDAIKSESDKIQGIDDNVDSVKGTVEALPSASDIQSEMEGSGTKLSQLNNRLSSARANLLDNLDATVSSRVEYVAPVEEDASAGVAAKPGYPPTFEEIEEADLEATATVDFSGTNAKIDAVKSVVDGNAGKIDVVDSVVDSIKVTTDKLGFNSDNDVKVTLDGEEVVTDSASRNASKATGFATSSDVTDAKNAIVGEINANEGKIDTVDSVVDSIKTVIDGVKATVDSNSSKIDVMDAIVDAIKTEVDKIQTVDDNVDTIDSVVDSIKSVVDSVSTKVDTVDNVVDGIKTSVDTVDGVVDGINERTRKLQFESEVGDATQPSYREKVHTYTDVEVTLPSGTEVNVDLSTVESGILDIQGKVTSVQDTIDERLDEKVSTRLKSDDYLPPVVSSSGAYEVKANVVQVNGKPVKLSDFNRLKVNDVVSAMERPGGTLDSINEVVDRVILTPEGRVVATLDGERVSIDNESRSSIAGLGIAKMSDVKAVNDGVNTARTVIRGDIVKAVGEIVGMIGAIKVSVDEESRKTDERVKMSTSEIGEAVDRISVLTDQCEELMKRVDSIALEDDELSDGKKRVWAKLDVGITTGVVSNGDVAQMSGGDVNNAEE